MLSADSLVSRALAPLTSEMNGELIMMDLSTGQYFGLGLIGTVIWRKLEHPITVADLCRDLVTRYAADVAVIERDVLILLEQMRAKDLIQVHDAA